MAPNLYHILILVSTLSFGAVSGIGEGLPVDGKWPFRLIPRQASFSNTSSPTAVPATTPCVNDCTVCAVAPYTFTWAQYTFTDTFVAATVVEVINTSDGKTKTSTIFNELPDGYTPPPTNSAGTQTTRLTYTQSGRDVTTEIAFPTEFAQWPDGYTWSGTLSTEADSTGGSTCAVASTSSSVLFPSYPQPPATMITRSDGIPDNEGLLFKPSYVIEPIGPYLATFTDLAAWASCSPCPLPAPALQALTVRFVTDTSTSYEDSGNGAATPSPAVASASSTPPKTSGTATKSSQPQSTSGSKTPTPNAQSSTGSKTPTPNAKSTTGSKTPTPNAQSQSQASAPTKTSAGNSATYQSQSPEPQSSSPESAQNNSPPNSNGSGPSSETSPATEVFTTTMQGPSGPRTLTITATDVSIVVATVGQVYTTVVAGPSGLTTLTAVKPGSSISGQASVMLSTTQVAQPDGSTRTFTVIAEPLASSGATTYTVIQSDNSGTSTRTVVGVNPGQTEPPAGLQNDAALAMGKRARVILGMALLISVGCNLVL